MKNYRAQTPENLALTKILQNSRKTSTPLERCECEESPESTTVQSREQSKSWIVLSSASFNYHPSLLFMDQYVHVVLLMGCFSRSKSQALQWVSVLMTVIQFRFYKSRSIQQCTSNSHHVGNTQVFLTRDHVMKHEWSLFQPQPASASATSASAITYF